MTGLPASIEAYLVDSGFSPTELLVLRHALSGQALTLRELASKTGKSTGVLDQATKKLLTKQILTREKINGTPKYTVDSLHSIHRWVQRDIRGKQELLKRKEQDFRQFVSSLELDSARPKMEYFEGPEGMEKAYMRLLDLAEKELFQFLPITSKEEDDPLRNFRVRYFRERKKRNIFLRVVAHDSPLGKRFQSRDVFEFRKTTLVAESQCPIPFEKIITGDTVACFNHAEERACFVHYPELAEMERNMFNILLCGNSQRILVPNSNKYVIDCGTNIAMHTKILSGLREFLLSKRGVASMAIFGLLSSFLTIGLYAHTIQLNKQRIRDKVQSIAATGTPLFQVADINELFSASDMEKDAYTKIVTTLDALRSNNIGVKYAYIIRPTPEKNVFEFVADADGLRIGQSIDFNNDGILGLEDEIPVPGLKYDVSEIPGAVLGLVAPVSINEPFTDQWGTFISGFAPIKNAKGETVAVLGVDQLAQDLYEITRRDLVPIYYFLILFIIFVCAKLEAENKWFTQKIWKFLSHRSVSDSNFTVDKQATA